MYYAYKNKTASIASIKADLTGTAQKASGATTGTTAETNTLDQTPATLA